MTKGNKPFDWRSTVLVTAGGAGVILVAAQLLAKPSTSTPRVVTTRKPATSPAANAAPPEVVLAANTNAAPGTGIRELFRPLVVPLKEGPRPLTNVPALPSVTPAPKPVQRPAPPRTVTTPPTPTTPPAPTGPSVSDIQMAGVVELGDQVQVLLKRTSTGESRYFTKGEDAFGFKVEEIKAEEVLLSHAGRTEKVAMSNEIQIEGPGTTAVAANSGFSGFRDRGNGGGFNGGGRRDRGNRGDGGNSGGGDSGFSTAQIMSLPTWSARLKKLEEVKGQMDAERYERLHKFMADRAAKETMK